MTRVLAMAIVLALGCRGRGADDPADAVVAAADERPGLSFTEWRDGSELFIELPALVRGVESRCAAHVTRLDGFTALSGGRVTVILRGGGEDERFTIDAPTQPGIFRPVVVPQQAGKRRLVVEIEAGDLRAIHDLGEVEVFADESAARAGTRDDDDASGRIPFLKEQQWAIDFGTTSAATRTLRRLLRANGRVVARPEGDLEINAPVAGRITGARAGFPRLGDRVEVDDELTVLAPRLEAADLASLDLAVKSSTLEVRFAERERERLEVLRKEGAVPERRLLDAMHAEEEAKAALGSAQRRLGQFRRVQRTSGKGEGTVHVRAPMTGTITAIEIAPGAFVEAGAPLLRVTDLNRVWVEARIPEADAPSIGQPRGASVFVEGWDSPLELRAADLVTLGSAIDADDHTLPVIFAVDNSELKLPIGAFARVMLQHGDDRSALAVPSSALVDDGGTTVIYVQTGGESFERRVVRTGLVDHGWVEIMSGVEVGERVVTTGAWSVKLAASSGTLPAHGHAH